MICVEKYMAGVESRSFDELVSMKEDLQFDICNLEDDIRMSIDDARTGSELGARYAASLQCLSALVNHMIGRVPEFVNENEWGGSGQGFRVSVEIG